VAVSGIGRLQPGFFSSHLSEIHSLHRPIKHERNLIGGCDRNATIWMSKQIQSCAIDNSAPVQQKSATLAIFFPDNEGS
jgi:hypothetical protein